MRRKLHDKLSPWNILNAAKKAAPKPPAPSLQSLSSATAPTATGSSNSSSNSSSNPLARPRRRTCRVYSITGGLVPYEEAWVWQQRLLHERMAWQRQDPQLEGHDVLLLLEHPSVYTLGRGSTLDNLRFDPADAACKHQVRRTDRGGEVTWHGPGQLVGYPVLDLNYHKKDLHWYLRQLEEVSPSQLRVFALCTRVVSTPKVCDTVGVATTPLTVHQGKQFAITWGDGRVGR